MADDERKPCFDLAIQNVVSKLNIEPSESRNLYFP